MSDGKEGMADGTLDDIFKLVVVPPRDSSRRAGPRSKGLAQIVTNEAREARTLRMHREALAKNPAAYTADLVRIQKTAVQHLKKCGFVRVTRDRCASLIDRFVDVIFDTQDRLPFFHVVSDLPYCWNAPKDWDKNYIRYEWGHLSSRNQNEDAHNIENLCLQSARCNQHIQTSMDIKEVLIWLEGSRVAERVHNVLERRRLLFGSNSWKELLDELSRFR